MAVLRLTELTKHFGATRALDGVDLVLKRGEVHALIGENGAGKSTLLNVLAGAIRPDGGSIQLNNEPYRPATTLDARRCGIALIHQELMLAQHLSVAENILMGIEKTRFGWLDRKDLYKRAFETLADFDHGDISPDSTVGGLSIAARQIVEICRAIAADSEIILMDEPTSSLSGADVGRLFTQIGKLRSRGISIIYISHFLEEVREIADSFTVLRDGKSVATGNIADVSDDVLISKMVGRSVENFFPARTPCQGDRTVLEVTGLSAPPALRSASFDLKSGEILGIAGLMGSGRSEMVRMLFRLDDARSGTVSIHGKMALAIDGTPKTQLEQGVGYLSEDRKREGLALGLSISDNLTMTRFSKCSRFGWVDLAEQKSQTLDMMNAVGVKAAGAGGRVGDLSGGNQQKVAIARLIYQDADILLLDEPTRGVDIGSKTQVYEIIARLAGEGKAILMISSYLPELFGMCDRLAVMSRGILSEARPISEWTPETVMETAIGGT